MAKAKRINLALQGGGAHGAFTWGVLDALLEQSGIEIGWVSAASAGAVNAVALAAGMAEGGREGGRAKLAEVWQAVHKAAVPDFVRLNPFLSSLSNVSAASGVGRMFSPYQFNPMGFDPLRRLLTETIDFAKLRAASPIELLIAATEVSTGRARHFRRDEMTVDAVLASACLPTLHHAVEIEGRAYWDGGFSANPELVKLALTSPVDDTLIVLLNPTSKSGVPTSSLEIAAETGRLTFNAPLMRDIEIIEAVREAEGGWLQRRFKRPSRLAPLVTHRFHLIDAGRHTAALPAGSKLKPDWALFTYLHHAGRSETLKWLDANAASIGRRSSVDLKARFLSPTPRFAVPLPPPAPSINVPNEPPASPAAPAAHTPR
ncbi:MAG: patatin-like phospholipase family protein [Hyphomicrobiaceae bacterium]